MSQTQARVLIMLLTLYWLCLSLVKGNENLEVGEQCSTYGYTSYCQPAENCKTLRQFIETQRLKQEEVLNCGYTVIGEKICCPVETEDLDICPSYLSYCQPAEDCKTLNRFIESGRLKVEEVRNCGYTITGEKICCPVESR